MNHLDCILFFVWYSLIYKIKFKESFMSQTISAKNSAKTGITFGASLAIVISYVNWHSIGWAIVHGILGWGYVIYYLIRY